MDLTEKLLESKQVFSGGLLRVLCDTVQLPNGKQSARELVRHPGGACVCAIDDQLRVAMVRQFRYACGGETLELPAGKIDAGEEPLETALRELQEEAGLAAEDVIDLGAMYPSPGYTDEVVHMYLALHAQPCAQQLDADEFLQVEKIHLGDALEQVMRGAILDAKTQICLLKSFLVLENMIAQQSQSE